MALTMTITLTSALPSIWSWWNNAVLSISPLIPPGMELLYDANYTLGCQDFCISLLMFSPNKIVALYILLNYSMTSYLLIHQIFLYLFHSDSEILDSRCSSSKPKSSSSLLIS